MERPDVMSAALRTLFEGAPQAMLVVRVDGERLQILAVNDALCAQTGYRRDQLIGSDARDLQPPAVVDEFMQRVARLRTTRQPVRYRVTRDVPAGRLTFETTLLPVSGDDDDEPTVFVAVGEDVSEHVRTANLLAETQQLANIGSWLRNLRDDTVTWSEAMYRIFGVSPAEFHPSYEAFFSLVHPEDRERVRSHVEGALRSREPFELEFRARRPDGAVRIMNARGHVVADGDGKLLRMAGTTQDVTAARAAAEYTQQLHEAQTRRRQALELNDDVLQGLSAARLALGVGDHERAQAALDRTLDAVRALIADLLAHAPPLTPGSLVRREAAGVQRS